MATIRQRGKAWTTTIRRSILPKAHYATFDTKEEAERYSNYIEGQLDQGIIPQELIGDTLEVKKETVYEWSVAYLETVAISEMDHDILSSDNMMKAMSQWPTSGVSMIWAEEWIKTMKEVDNLAPGTIKHKVGAVSRMFDWCLNKGWLVVNPLRMLPRGYAHYAKSSNNARSDMERDRRLMPGEYERIINILDGGKPDDKQRGIKDEDRPAWKMIFILATESAMRLREMYCLSAYQIHIDGKTVFLEKTKNGDKRQVPLTSVATTELSKWIQGMNSDDLVFPWWDGDLSPIALRRTTIRLSRKWGTIARLANCPDLRFHDLRHEATSRFYERTKLSDVQISKITGHKDPRMLKRYANLRASDLASELW